MRIVEKLITYVESTLDAKLEKIGQLMAKNCTNLELVRKKVAMAEIDVLKIKREKEAVPGSLLSEDIRFFFNIVKANPNLKREDIEDYQFQPPQPKYDSGSRK